MAQHPQLRRNELELLADLLADALKRSAILTANLLLVRQVVEDLDAGDPVRKRFAAPLLARVGFDEDRAVCLLSGIRLAKRRLGFIEQPDLRVVGLFTLPTKSLVLEQADVLAKRSELFGLCVDQRHLLVELMQLRVDLFLLTECQLAERFEIVGKIDRID